MRSHSVSHAPAIEPQSVPKPRYAKSPFGIVDVALCGARQLARGEHGAQRACRFDLLAHEIADALVGGQVIVVATIQCRADAQLLGPATPMHDVVARAERRESSEVMHVDFAGVARHRLGETEHIGAAGAQEVQPQPDVGRRAPSCPTRIRRRRSATRGDRNRRCASRRRSSRSRTSRADPAVRGRNRTASRAALRAARVPPVSAMAARTSGRRRLSRTRSAASAP